MQRKRISARIKTALYRRLAKTARLKGKNESEIVREALDAYLEQKPGGESCYDLALRAGIIGASRTGPTDLSTNRRYFKGFGE